MMHKIICTTASLREVKIFIILESSDKILLKLALLYLIAYLSYDRTIFSCQYVNISIVLCQDKEEKIMARIIDGENMNIVGHNIRRLRCEKKMSQQALSNQLELLGVYVCRGSVSRIEDKQRTVTDIELYAFAKVLGVEISDLFEEIKY